MHVTSSASSPLRWLCLPLLLIAVLLVVAAPAAAQMTKERVEIPTDDGVTLVGDWYPSDKGKSGPVIVLLHPIGPGKEGAKRQDWEKFPEKLQKAGFHTLAFDFRGYGDSTKLEDKMKYWTTPNRYIPRPLGTTPPNTISAKDWRNAHVLLWLGNDLIAVKKWLNLKNNAMECNSSNICLMAAEQSGVLAELFIYNEFSDPNRDKANDWSKPIAAQLRNPSKFEGDDYNRLILLSMPNKLGATSYQQALKERMLGLTQKRAIDTLTIYGGDDAPVKTFWSEAIKWIKPEKEIKELDKTGRIEVPKTKLSGISLLTNDALGVEKGVLDHLDKHLRTGKTWQKQKEDERPVLFNIQYAVSTPAARLP
jgi:pimeloyl-ACP methyl ester carboxylesterase